MVSREQKIVLLFAAAVLLFVVLCPATPTPTAVVKNQVVAGVLMVASPAALLWKPIDPVFLSAGDGHFVRREAGPSILELTCTRIC